MVICAMYYIIMYIFSRAECVCVHVYERIREIVHTKVSYITYLPGLVVPSHLEHLVGHKGQVSHNNDYLQCIPLNL